MPKDALPNGNAPQETVSKPFPRVFEMQTKLHRKHPWPARNGPQPPPFPIAEPTLSFDQIRQCVSDAMPGAVMRHLLGFRHTIASTKSADT